MKTIWKYPLTKLRGQPLMLPEGAEILSVQVQDGHPCLWALIDPEAPRVERIFEIFGTGHPCPDTVVKRQYIDTFQLQGGALVFHVFVWEA